MPVTPETYPHLAALLHQNMLCLLNIHICGGIYLRLVH